MKTKDFECDGVKWCVYYITKKPKELSVFKDSKQHTVIERTHMVGKDWAMNYLCQIFSSHFPISEEISKEMAKQVIDVGTLKE